jgi:hypothetical protein
MAYRGWLKLMSGLVYNASPATLMALLIDANTEDTSAETLSALQRIESSLQRMMNEPLASATEFLKNAQNATGSYRIHCIEHARDDFIKAANLAPPAMTPDFTDIDSHIVLAKTHGYAGVCAGLLEQPEIARTDYETSCAKALAIEETLWTFITPSEWETNGSWLLAFAFRTQRVANCKMSRRALPAYMKKFYVAGRSQQIFEELYATMKPLIKLLHKLNSSMLLPKEDDLRLDNRDRAATFIAKHRDGYCPKDSAWYRQ